MITTNKKHEMQQAITWDLRCMRSGFGSQVFSHMRTEPSGAFGTGHRDAYGKMYLSADHARASPGNNSQGAVYKIYGGCGMQVDSLRPSSARPVIGTAPRNTISDASKAPGPGNYKYEQSIGPQKDSRRATSARAMIGTGMRDPHSDLGKLTPGPVYSLSSGIGKQLLSTKPNNRSVGFGTASRFRSTATHPIHGSPGAGQYSSNHPGLGRQILSKSKTLPAFGMGTASRDVSKVFISMEHEKAQYGHNTPGPVTCRPTSAFQKQMMSHKRTQPRATFGRSRRQPPYGKNGVPGPGTYCA
eukprot:jgi/Ulvmu1/2969/UM015_0009.1